MPRKHRHPREYEPLFGYVGPLHTGGITAHCDEDPCKTEFRSEFRRPTQHPIPTVRNPVQCSVTKMVEAYFVTDYTPYFNEKFGVRW